MYHSQMIEELAKRSDLTIPKLKNKLAIAEVISASTEESTSMVLKKMLGQVDSRFIFAFNQAHNSIAAKSNVRKPLQSTPPLGINPEAINIWKETLKTKKKIINKYKDNREKWAAAIVLFKQSCKALGIAPFLHTNKMDVTKNPTTSFLASYVKPCLDSANAMIKYMKQKKLSVKKVPVGWKFKKIKKEGMTRKVYASKIVRMPKGESASAIMPLLMHKFGVVKVKQNTFMKRIGPKANLRIKYAHANDNALEMYIIIVIGKKYWNALQSGKKKPEAFIKGWINRGFKATGKFAEERLDEVSKLFTLASAEDVNSLMFTSDMNYVVNAFDPEEQTAFVEHVVGSAIKFAVEIPKKYLRFLVDAEYREDLNERYSHNPFKTFTESTFGPKLIRE